MKSIPKLKSGLSSETSALHLRHRKKGQKITNFNDQQKEPKWSKNHHKKGPEITKKEASSVAESPPSLDLDLYFSKSPDLPEWWR
jgi:hypothetical protein